MAEIPVSNFTNNIPNTTVNGSGEYGYSAVITVVCEDGFVFNGTPTISYTDYWGDYYSNKQMTVSEDGTTATYTIAESDGDRQEATLTGETIANSGEPIPRLTNNIAKTTGTITQTADNSATIIITGTLNRTTGFINVVVSYLSTDGTTKTATDVNYSFNSSNREVLTCNIPDVDFSQPVIVNGSYESGVVRVNSVNLSNCVATGLKDRYGKNETADIQLTANSGFKFVDAPVVSYIDDYYSTQQTKAFTLSEDSTTATLKQNLYMLTDIDYSKGVTFSGSAVASVVRPTITSEITGRETTTTATFNEDSTAVDIAVEIVSGSPTKVNFTETPVATYTDNTGVEKSVELAVDNTGYRAKATITISDFEPTTTILLTGEVSEIISTSETFENCSVDGLKPFYKPTDTINITLTANTGCKFDTENPPVASFNGEYGEYVAKYFEVSEDLKTATFTLDLTTVEITSAIGFSGGAIADTGGYETNYGAINLYIVTNDDLEKFATKRFVRYNEDGTGELIDLAKYINRIRRVFVNVEDVVSNVLKLGNYNMDIDCYSPTTNRITLDFGTVQLPLNNNDVADFNSEIQIFLPFIGFQQVDNAFCGRELGLKYVVDLVTGDGIAQLFVDGNLIDVFNCQPSAEVIYRLSDFTQIGGDDFNPQMLYGLQPFVKFKWFKSENNNTINADNERVLIGSVNGFARFTDITDIVSEQLTGDEKKMIYQLLNTGVYVQQQQTTEN